MIFDAIKRNGGGMEPSLRAYDDVVVIALVITDPLSIIWFVCADTRESYPLVSMDFFDSKSINPASPAGNDVLDLPGIVKPV